MGETKENDLGKAKEEYDTPGQLADAKRIFTNRSKTETAQAVYKLDPNTWRYDQTFSVWLVVFNNETDQYVPLMGPCSRFSGESTS